MEITGDTTVLGFALYWAWQLGLHSFILMYLLGNALNLKSQNLERVSAVPQKKPGTNAVCASNLVFLFFNSFHTINMGEGESCLHDCLSSPPVPSLKKKKKHLSSLCSTLAAQTNGWWQSWPGGGSGGPYVKQNARCLCGSFAHVLPGWLIPLKAGDLWEHGVTRGSVQSQEWLSVLILSLFLVFQGPSFYHRLRSNNRGSRKIQLQTIHGGNNFGILENIQVLCSPY